MAREQAGAETVSDEEVDVVTPRMPLADAPAGYRTFRDRQDDCVKGVLRPRPAAA